jgi:hypothetical protein
MTVASEDKRYHRVVEEAWSRLRDRPSLLSPREFEIVEGWRRRGIPTRVVLEVMNGRARRHAAGGRSIAVLAAAVEEAWSALAAGRTAPAPAASEPPAKNPRDAWAGALERWRGHAPLGALLRSLIAAAERGASVQEIDERLDAALADAAPAELRGAAERATSVALAPFRGRMPEDEFQRTSTRARLDRLRDALELPRLA